MRRIDPSLIIAALLMTLMAPPANADEQLYFIAPTQIPNVSREMKTAGYWVSRVAKPDAVIMDAAAIKAFNRQILEKSQLTKDLRMFPEHYDGQVFKQALLARLEQLKNQNYFADDGRVFVQPVVPP